MAKIIIRNPQPFAQKRTERHTAAHTCHICGRHIFGAASICPDCLWKQGEKGEAHDAK